MVQHTRVHGKELVRRRFYLSEMIWDYIEGLSQEYDCSPSIVIESILYDNMKKQLIKPHKLTERQRTLMYDDCDERGKDYC